MAVAVIAAAVGGERHARHPAAVPAPSAIPPISIRPAEEGERLVPLQRRLASTSALLPTLRTAAGVITPALAPSPWVRPQNRVGQTQRSRIFLLGEGVKEGIGRRVVLKRSRSRLGGCGKRRSRLDRANRIA